MNVLAPSADPRALTRTAWTTRGFEAFREGNFGNGGQNLYVSRKGIVQRIFHHDVNADGYIDLMFCNSQNHWEIPPSYEYRWNGKSFDRLEIPLTGCSAAAIGDLNNDGRTDLVAGLWYNGVGFDVNTTIYYGLSCNDRKHHKTPLPRWNEQAMRLVPAPFCTSIAIGDFNGNGHADIAIGCHKNLRLFAQTEKGLAAKTYTDLPIAPEMLAAADLDGDGTDELIVRFRSGRVRIYWGAADGISVDRFTDVDAPGDAIPPENAPVNDGARPSVEWVEEPFPQMNVVYIQKVPHLLVARQDEAWLVPAQAGRTLGEPVRIPCAQVMAIAVADIDGDGHDDYIVASRSGGKLSEKSYIYWGNHPAGWQQEPTPLPSDRACDVAVGDFNQDGKLEVALCQSYDDDWFTRTSPIYQFAGRSPQLWQSVETHDARKLFVLPHPAGTGHALIVMNRQGRNRVGEVPATIYLGSADGFAADRKIDLPGWGSTVGVMADFNDDGICDVAFANTAENSVDRDPGSYIYIQSKTGFTEKPTQIFPTKRAHGIACGDIDRDGYLDLIFAGFSNDEITIFHGGPNGFDMENPTRIRTELDGKVYDQHRFIQLADINNDGWLDLLIPLIDCDHSLILFGGPDGFSMKNSQKLDVWHAISARAADLDGDGYLDLIIASHMASTEGPHDSHAHIYWNGPDGLSDDRKTLLPCAAANSMSIADFNNDGNLDLFIGSYQMTWKKRDSESFIYWNRGGRGFSSHDFTRLFTHSASGDMAADFNEDGWVDLAVANHKKYGDHSTNSQVWWNGPNGFDENKTTGLPTDGPHGMGNLGPGNIMDRGPEEYYTSVAHELADDAVLSRIAWKADLPIKTWVHAQVRFASTREGLSRAPWTGPGGADTWFTESSDIDPSLQPADAQYVQYRLALGAINGGSSPRVHEVTMEFATK